MSNGSRVDKMATRDLEKLLSEALVSVEPSTKFVKRLKAKLVRYHGNKPFSGWLILGSFAMALMLLLTWLGMALRLVLLIFSLIGVLDRKRKSRNNSTLPIAGS